MRTRSRSTWRRVRTAATVDKLRRVLEREVQPVDSPAPPGEFIPEETRTHDVRQAFFDATPAARSDPPVGPGPGALRSADCSGAGRHPAGAGPASRLRIAEGIGTRRHGGGLPGPQSHDGPIGSAQGAEPVAVGPPGCARERFQQEIRLAAKLSHPNIVAAYSVLRPGDLLVFAMEYVDGQDLAQLSSNAARCR